jgi:hypothetical protein
VFKIFLFYIVLIGAILPVAYTLLIQGGSLDAHYFYNYASDDSFFIGNIYTIISTLIMLFVAIRLKPIALSFNQEYHHHLIYSKYANVIFVMGVVSLTISILLSYLYGMSAVNLTSTRPMLPTYLGYLSRVLYLASELYIYYQILLFNKLSRKGWLMMILLLLSLSMSWSRSGLMSILFIYLVASAYSFRKSQIKWNYLFYLFLLGSSAVFFGQYMRSGNIFDILPQILLRFYANNSVLYLAITDNIGIYNILMRDQPWALLDQLFSFIIERTHYPSSLRLVEYFGGEINAGPRGHIVGYAYGWLGLTYGLFQWFGLIAIYFAFVTIFGVIRKSIIHPSLLRMIFFVVSSKVLLEFFGNLGLDSFLEKIFKMSLSAVILVLIIKVTYSLLYSCNIIKKNRKLVLRKDN